jgi:hypothetical protein
MERLSIKTSDGEDVYYTLDPTADDTGFGLGTIPITEKINSKLYIIKEEDLSKLSLTDKERKYLDYCNIGIENLSGKYYDKEGFIYYGLGNQIHRFMMKLVFFKKLYKRTVK